MRIQEQLANIPDRDGNRASTYKGPFRATIGTGEFCFSIRPMRESGPKSHSATRPEPRPDRGRQRSVSVPSAFRKVRERRVDA